MLKYGYFAKFYSPRIVKSKCKIANSERDACKSNDSRLTELSRKSSMNNPPPTFISIHVRRTDYSHHLSVLYNMTFVDNGYFENATNYFRNKLKVIRHLQIFHDIALFRFINIEWH